MSRFLTAPPKLGNVTMKELCACIAEARCHLSIEARTQADLYQHLLNRYPALSEGIVRELRLSKEDRVDVWFNGIVVEAKLKGKGQRAFAIYRQIERYAEHPDVEGIILATTITMALPDAINGKPALLVNLGKAWMR